MNMYGLTSAPCCRLSDRRLKSDYRGWPAEAGRGTQPVTDTVTADNFTCFTCLMVKTSVKHVKHHTKFYVVAHLGYDGLE